MSACRGRVRSCSLDRSKQHNMRFAWCAPMIPNVRVQHVFINFVSAPWKRICTVYCRLDRDPVWHTVVAVMQTNNMSGYLWMIYRTNIQVLFCLCWRTTDVVIWCHLYTSTAHGSLLNQREMEPAKSRGLQKPPFKHDQHQVNIIPGIGMISTKGNTCAVSQKNLLGLEYNPTTTLGTAWPHLWPQL